MKRLLRVICLCLLALVLVPTTALARDYTVTDVNIYADVQTDGSVQIVDRRTYSFSGEFNGIYWDIPRGSFEARVIEATDIVVIVNGSDKALGPDEYEVEEHDDYIRLTINYHVVNKSVTFEVWYTLTNLVTRWADVGELYWQYVPKDGESGKEWPNVTCTVQLCAPEGEKIEPGENVRAWGHGPLDSTVSFKDDSVVFKSPGVGSSEFLEARVAFPAEWLDRVPEGSEDHLDTIIEEEAAWAKEANARRRNARIAAWGTPIAMYVAGLGSILAGYLSTKGFFNKQKKKAEFTEKYYRDVPTNDHPAVLGKLYNDGDITGNEFTATLMNLVDRGLIELDSVEVEKLNKKNKVVTVQEWRLTRVHVPVEKITYAFAMTEHSAAIDEAAMTFLFNKVAKNKSLDDKLRGYMGEPYVLSSFFEDVAHKAAKDYEDGYTLWTTAVEDAFDARGFVEGTESSIFPGAIGLVDFVLATVLGLLGVLFGAPDILLLPAVILLFGAGIFCVMVDKNAPVAIFSQEAAEIKAKLEALKRWLTDYTKLEEAIPTDVVLWNRLLVMATVLGVADKVVDQLKVHAPQLLADEDFTAYGWYEPKERIKPAAALLATSYTAGKLQSYGELHTYTTSELADSSDSSYSGSGGGFSGGGGGGFSGGGGRGGAF